jgi:hypothetical protein
MINLKYHHLGIPTKEKHEDETFLEKFQMYVSGYDTSQYKIEWMRFEKDAPLPEIVKTIPHVAFEVDNLDEAIKGKDILIEPNSPSPGVIVAFIIENGAPVELMQIDRSIAKEL